MRSRGGSWPQQALALVQKYAPELERRCRPHLKLTDDSWRVDETYIKVKGEDRYLYWAVDSDRNTLDFLLTTLAGYTSRKPVLQ